MPCLKNNPFDLADEDQFSQLFYRQILKETVLCICDKTSPLILTMFCPTL